MTRRTYLEAVRRPNPRRAGAEGESSPSPRTDTPGCDDQEATDRRDNLVYALSDWLAFDCVKEVFSDLDEEEWCLFDTAAAGVTGEDTNIDANVNNKEVEAVSCVSCRAHFDPALTGKENKEALKEEVAWALAGLGLAIDDEGDVRFHHLKLVYDEDAKPQFVVMIMDVVAGPATAKMKTGGVFAKRAHKRAASAFTVKWGKVDPAREAQPEPGTSSRARPAGLWAPPEETKETKETKEMKPTEETKETKETESQRVNVGATKKDVDTTTTTTIKAVYGCEDRDAILVPKPAPIITIRQSPAWPDVGELTAGTTLHAWGPNRSWHH